MMDKTELEGHVGFVVYVVKSFFYPKKKNHTMDYLCLQADVRLFLEKMSIIIDATEEQSVVVKPTDVLSPVEQELEDGEEEEDQEPVIPVAKIRDGLPLYEQSAQLRMYPESYDNRNGDIIEGSLVKEAEAVLEAVEDVLPLPGIYATSITPQDRVTYGEMCELLSSETRRTLPTNETVIDLLRRIHNALQSPMIDYEQMERNKIVRTPMTLVEARNIATRDLKDRPKHYLDMKRRKNTSKRDLDYYDEGGEYEQQLNINLDIINNRAENAREWTADALRLITTYETSLNETDSDVPAVDNLSPDTSVPPISFSTYYSPTSDMFHNNVEFQELINEIGKQQYPEDVTVFARHLNKFKQLGKLQNVIAINVAHMYRGRAVSWITTPQLVLQIRGSKYHPPIVAPAPVKSKFDYINRIYVYLDKALTRYNFAKHHPSNNTYRQIQEEINTLYPLIQFDATNDMHRVAAKIISTVFQTRVSPNFDYIRNKVDNESALRRLLQQLWYTPDSMDERRRNELFSEGLYRYFDYIRHNVDYVPLFNTTFATLLTMVPELNTIRPVHGTGPKPIRGGASPQQILAALKLREQFRTRGTIFTDATKKQLLNDIVHSADVTNPSGVGDKSMAYNDQDTIKLNTVIQYMNTTVENQANADAAAEINKANAVIDNHVKQAADAVVTAANAANTAEFASTEAIKAVAAIDTALNTIVKLKSKALQMKGNDSYRADVENATNAAITASNEASAKAAVANNALQEVTEALGLAADGLDALEQYEREKVRTIPTKSVRKVVKTAVDTAIITVKAHIETAWNHHNMAQPAVEAANLATTDIAAKVGIAKSTAGSALWVATSKKRPIVDVPSSTNPPQTQRSRTSEPGAGGAGLVGRSKKRRIGNKRVMY
jgi:hypothetical protein